MYVPQGGSNSRQNSFRIRCGLQVAFLKCDAQVAMINCQHYSADRGRIAVLFFGPRIPEFRHESHNLLDVCTGLALTIWRRVYSLQQHMGSVCLN